MSTKKNIAKLANLSPKELQVEAKMQELLGQRKGTAMRSWGAALLEVAGTASGLPSDFAHNHDHDLHGLPKR
jgi:hypothetical protein